MKLYELVEARDILDQFLAEEEGEETPTIAALWQQLDGELDQKGERVALWIREKEAEVAALKAEEAWLARKRKARENAIAASKRYFCELLQQLARQELGTARAKLARQAGAPKLEGELTPEQLAALALESSNPKYRELVRIVPATTSLDRAAALALLKAGGKIAGLRVVETEHVRIR